MSLRGPEVEFATRAAESSCSYHRSNTVSAALGLRTNFPDAEPGLATQRVSVRGENGGNQRSVRAKHEPRSPSLLESAFTLVCHRRSSTLVSDMEDIESEGKSGLRSTSEAATIHFFAEEFAYFKRRPSLAVAAIGSG